MFTFLKFFPGQREFYIKIARNESKINFSIMSDYFYFNLWSRYAGRIGQTYENSNFLKLFLAVAVNC